MIPHLSQLFKYWQFYGTLKYKVPISIVAINHIDHLIDSILWRMIWTTYRLMCWFFLCNPILLISQCVGNTVNKQMDTVILHLSLLMFPIRRRSDYIIGFVTPAIGPNKSKKLTQLIAPVHHIRGKVEWKTACMASQTTNYCVWSHVYAVFHSNFAACIVCRLYKPCEFLEFVWTDYWGNKSNYVITSPANMNQY